MASLAEKTKDTNTFRFKSFGDRVNEIDLRRLALYHIGHRNEELDEAETETYFQQTLQKWNVLNLTEEYNYFSKRCRKIVTLPQLLHQKDFVIDLLLERLATATNLSQQPLLELLYVLARDLREEFYQYFQRVLDRLICLLNTQDSEQLEWTLICLAHLFKTLKPYLKRNIGVVFNAILPLLDEQHYAEHVTNFAVECFAYIARDVRDFPRFLAYVLKTVLREQVESIKGCGRLIYEILRGVNGQLHNSAGDLVAQILDVLVNKEATYTSDQTDLLAEILEHSLALILPYVKTDQMSILWQKLCLAIGPDEDKYIVNLMLPLVSYKDGRYISELTLIVSTLLKQLDQSKQVQQSLTSLITHLLTASHAQLTQLDASRLLSKLLATSEKSFSIYESSILELLNYPQFELLVLPHVIAHYEASKGDLASLELLGRIILHKRPLQLDATSLSQWQIYPLQLKQKSTMDKLAKDLAKIDLTTEEHLLLLLLVPHFRGFSKDFLEKSIQKAIEDHLTTLSKDHLVLLLLLQTYFLLKYKLPTKLGINLHQSLLPSLSNDLWALACLELLLIELPKKDLAQSKETKAALAPLLTHSQVQYRRMSSHCLQLLGSLENSKTNPYTYFHAANCVQPTVHNYRELLLQLQQLEPSSLHFKDYSQLPHFKEHTISLLLGLLYNNFKFIWAPVQQLLAAYVKEMGIEDFWLIFKDKLETTVAIIHHKNEDSKLSAKRRSFISSTLTLMLPQDAEETVVAQEQNVQQALNYRQLLWQCIPKMGQVAEVKNKDIVRLFLDFIEVEYHGQLEKAEYTWNVTEEKEDSQFLEENDDDDEAEESPSQTRRKRKNYNTQTKFILQTLQLKLACFTIQPNPKALYRQTELKEFYLELLAGPNPQLQQLALDCLVKYKDPTALVQHKSTLSDLIDELKFKSTLSTWNLSNLQTEERAQLLPFVLRLLYGKMLTKGSQKQLSAQQRKTLILRFLGQLEELEILNFLQMAFGRFNIYTDKPIEELHIEVIKHYEPSAVIAAKQLQRVVNLLELIRKEFAGKLSEKFQSYVLKLLLLVGSVAQQVINGGEGGKLMVAYKNVKHAGLQTLVNYFQHLVDMHELWQEPEIQAICEVYIWPNLSRLSQDSIHNPTPLLKLLLLWGAEVNYQKWLKRQPEKGADPIIQHLVALLLNEKAKPVVKRSLLQLIEQILEATALDEYKEEALSLIRPYIPEILKHLQGNWQRKTKKQMLDKRELNILTLITSHVDDSSTCDLLLQLVLPIFSKQVAGAGPEMVIQLITTLSNLLKRVKQPHIYVNQLAPLFELVQVIPARKMLCEILTDMAKQLHKAVKDQPQLSAQATALRESARIVYLLNAWNKRWIEQPDYDKRLEALKEVKEMVLEEKKQLDMQLAILVVYNCFYMLRHDNDLGLRVNIGELLKGLLPQLTIQLAEKERNFWLDDILMPLFQRYIRDEKHEHARSEAISALGEMARQCPIDCHEVLRDLAPLTDKHDLEVDFFENILHLQTQRHGRALQRVVNISAGKWRQMPQPCARTLTHVLMPLTTRYLLNDKHTGKHTLIDAAIEAVGVMCELLPWQQYLAILRYYLNKLRYSQTHQKQCVRLVVRILDAFHFDLSQGQTDLIMLNKLKEQLIETIPEETKPKEEEQGETNETSVKEEADELDFEAENEEEEAEEVTTTTQVTRTSYLLSANAAKRVIATITTILLPALNRSITEKTNYDAKHKVNRRRLSYEREEEDIQRVPIALAMVKLLQKLPSDLMENSLPGIFMKVCTFLRSPLKSVRMLTRDILKKIMLTLGGSYLGLLLEQLQSLLTRGFQVHVLSVTLHGVLDALKGDENFKPAHIEDCLQNLLEVALNDIFGDVSAEKEVEKIVAHTPEAKPSAKSYLTLHIAARYIRDNCLLDLLLPFKGHLARTHSRKVTQKIQECFAKIVSGLVENPHIARESLLIFIYGTMSESISDLMPGTQKRQLTAKEQALMKRARPDCLLLQPAPSRRSVEVAGNKQVKSNAQANAHILIEFGLELLHFVLKRKKLNELDYEPFLQPLLPLLKDSLSSSHARTTTYALKCYTAIWVGDYKLSELGAVELEPVVKRMFEILKNFSTFGATRQEENAQLVRSSFKAVVALLRKCEEFKLNDEQIEQLLLHIEQELQEGECSSQSMCFTLLKALVNRKVDTRSLHDLMRRLADLAIISQSDYVRDESRGILLIYLMEYTLQKQVDQMVKFMSVQLCYSQTAGRQSAIQFMHSIINKFPQLILAKQSEFLYLSLGTRLVNDEDPTCRRKVASALEALLGRLNKVERQPLLDLTLLFFTSEQETRRKAGVREMAAALLSRFVLAEKSQFADRLPQVLPILVNVLTIGDAEAGGRFVRAPGNLNNAAEHFDDPKNKKKKRRKLHQEDILEAVDPETELEEKQRGLDHQIIQLQYCLLKIFEHCGESLFSNDSLAPTLDELAYGCQRLLGHEHNWVRCNAAKLLAQILSHYDYDYVGQQLTGIKREQESEEKSLEFIYHQPAHDIKSLVLDLCAQCIPGETASEMIDELAKIMLYIAQMMRDVPFGLKQEIKLEQDDDEENETQTNKINLYWLVRNIRFLINREVAKAPHDTSLRTALFTVIEGLSTLLSVDAVTKLAPALLQALVREMSEEDQNVDADLRQLALTVGSRLRKRIGSDIYDKLRNSVQTKLMVRRAERRKAVAQEKIHDPESAAKRKAGVQERKKAAKRLKTAVIRGKAPDTKQKLKKRKRKAEFDGF
ncbi:small subunit processome component 20 homolog [Drosophila tropicalis]|uniref:small subunit processome component 20 homolog n=1 Tax=Drosophila tropicalis TaxID=46794 RepID=UPI0035ABD0CC